MATGLSALSQQVGEHLVNAGLKLATAESCTGGWVAREITAIPGSSAWFDRGFVTYTDLSKQQMLDVPAITLEQHGAVSEAVAGAMVAGALAHSEAQMAVAVSGIAGPGGATETKPVGMVCFAWGRQGGDIRTGTMVFDGDREAVREQAVRHALQGVLETG